MAKDHNNIHTILGPYDVPVCKVTVYLPRNAANQAKTGTAAQMPNVVHVADNELHTELGALISQMRNLNDRLQARSPSEESVLDIGASEFENSTSMRDVNKSEVEQYMKEILEKLEEKVRTKVSETIEKFEAYEEERFAIQLEAFRKDQLESTKRLRDILIRMHVLDRETHSPTPPPFDPKNEILWDLLHRYIVSPLQRAHFTSNSTSSKSLNKRKPIPSSRRGKWKDSAVSEAQNTTAIPSDSDYEPDSPILNKSVLAPAVTTRAGYIVQLVSQTSKGNAKRENPATYQTDTASSSKSSNDSEEPEEVPRIANGRFLSKKLSIEATTPTNNDGKKTTPAPQSEKRVRKESYSSSEGQKKKKPKTAFQRMIDMSRGGNVSSKKKMSGYGYYSLKQDFDS